MAPGVFCRAGAHGCAGRSHAGRLPEEEMALDLVKFRLQQRTALNIIKPEVEVK